MSMQTLNSCPDSPCLILHFLKSFKSPFTEKKKEKALKSELQPVFGPVNEV